MTIDLRPVLERPAPEHREALLDRAEREGVSIGQLVKGWIQSRLESRDPFEAALSEAERLTSLSLDDLLAGSRFSGVLHRCAEIDAALELTDGHGIAETLLGGLIDDIERGDYGLILGGWDFGDGGDEWATEKLAGLAARWKEAA